MATPLAADRIVEALRAEGVKLVELPGWRTHNRNHKGAWGPVNGVMLHYTAGHPGSLAREAAYAKNILYDGYAGLPGPLCQFGIGTDGTVYLTGWGRANHAGTINAAALARVIDGTLSLDSTETPGPDQVDGNSRLYGIECITAGNLTEPQREAAVRVCVAICRAHGWSGRDVIGHGEATRRKTGDPRGVNMGHFRRDVMARLRNPVDAAPKPTPPTTPPPTTPILEEDPVPTHRELRPTLQHSGKDWQLMDGSIVEAKDHPQRASVTAQLTAPPGVTGEARLVSYDNKGKRWVRYPAIPFRDGSCLLALQLGQGGPEADLRVDVRMDQPCTVSGLLAALAWEVK